MELLLLVLPIVVGIVTARLAARKGYNPFLWFFAAGIIGLTILAFLPFANDPNQSEEERGRLLEKGNNIALIFVVITFFWVIFQVFGLLAALSTT